MTKTVILALDTTITGCGLAIFKPDPTQNPQIITAYLETERGQAERLVPMIMDILNDSETETKDIACIAVTTGPGSFTGLRVGLSTARHLGLALDCPVLGLSTLDLLAHSAFTTRLTDHPFLVLIDTKRGDFYTQACSIQNNTLHNTAPAQIYTADDLIALLQEQPDLYLTGDTNSLAQSSFFIEQSPERQQRCLMNNQRPCVAHLARWAAEQTIIDPFYQPASMPCPVYVRGAEISQSKRIFHVVETLY